MSNELFERSAALLQESEKIEKFGSRYNEYPQQQAKAVHEGMRRIIEEVSDLLPSSEEELYIGELKRKLSAQALGLEHYLEGKPYTLEDIINYYGIELEDLSQLQPWLLENRQKTQDAIERLYEKSDITSYELALPSDIPRIRNQAEGFAATHIQNYHQKLGNLFENLTAAGSYLRNITSEPSTTERSYFNELTGRLGISMTAICYEVEDGTIQLRERELLSLFGHEGMGHGLHQVITSVSNLPYFLKKLSGATLATEEAITQHYERVIFEDIRGSKKTQRELHIADNFEEIYQEELDTRQITDFNRNLFYYAILVLADKSLGKQDDPEVIRKKIDLISNVALNPSVARNYVEGNRYKYDLDGNLSTEITSELRYSSKAARKALEAFERRGFDYSNREDRSSIDLTFLTGYFTPTGFIKRAELVSLLK